MPFCRHPPPHPRLRRSSPAPGGGGVRAWRYQGSSRARGFSRISPCCGPCGYRRGGRGRRGGGTRSPSPVSHTPTILLLAGIPCPRLLLVKHTLLPPPPPRPRLRRSSPAPSAGGVRARAYIRGAAVPGVEPVGHRARLFPTYPLALDRGDIATGGGADGEGELVPPPLSPTLPELRISHRPCPGSL